MVFQPRNAGFNSSLLVAAAEEMASSGDADEKKHIDESAGGLVWVRRRNGSWWPGRILGRNELPSSCSRTRRSGTPIKLLGRENASIDWYNLEKSTRVKAFRCGEYDECIKEAKASAANTSKKAVKYARREVAILHALELESARQSREETDMRSTIDKPCGVADCLEISPNIVLNEEVNDHVAEELSSSRGNSNSGQELAHSGVSFQEPNSKEQSAEGRRRRTPNDSEDDVTEGIKRMRGLEDLGKDVFSSSKRKRSQVSNVHDFLKKKSRRRQLTKVLESTVTVTVSVMRESLASPTGSSVLGVSDSKMSGLESNKSKRSSAMVINNSSDSTGENGTSFSASQHASDASFINCKQKENQISSMLGLPEGETCNTLFDVSFVGEDKQLAGFCPTYASSASQRPQVGTIGEYSQSSQVQTVSLGNEEFNESGSVSSVAPDTNVIGSRIEKGTSKWKLKGKRNLRNGSKNKHGLKSFVNVEDKSNGCFASLDPGDVSGSLISEGSAYQAEHRQVMKTQVDECHILSMHVPPIRSYMRPTSDLVAPQRLQPYRQSRSIVNPKYQSSEFPLRVHNSDSYLYYVNLEVRASYRSQHVPYVSLMSKSNGKPVVGHPLTVEALDDGFCDLLIGRSNCYSSSCGLDEIEDVCASQGVGKRKPSPGGGRVPSKYRQQSPCKSPKSRRNGHLSKKIRKLSSLTGPHKHRFERKEPVIQKLKGPAIACVPLKVVFSRINAALNSSI